MVQGVRNVEMPCLIDHNRCRKIQVAPVGAGPPSPETAWPRRYRSPHNARSHSSPSVGSTAPCLPCRSSRRDRHHPSATAAAVCALLLSGLELRPRDRPDTALSRSILRITWFSESAMKRFPVPSRDRLFGSFREAATAGLRHRTSQGLRYRQRSGSIQLGYLCSSASSVIDFAGWPRPSLLFRRRECQDFEYLSFDSRDRVFSRSPARWLPLPYPT